MGAWSADDSVTITCEVEFDADVWTDISDDLDDDVDWDRGKRSEYDLIQPGTMTVRLKNDDRRFDPENATGPYFGKLRPMKRIRLSIAVGVFSSAVFTGYVLGWPQQWGKWTSVASVRAVDGAKLDATLPASAYSVEVVNDGADWYWPIQAGDLTARVGDDGPLLPSDRLGGTVDFATRDSTAPVGEANATYGGVTDALDRPVTLADLPDVLEFWVDISGTGTDQVRVRAQIDSTTWMSIQVRNDGNMGIAYSHDADNLHSTVGGESVLATPGLAAGPNHIAMKRNSSNIEWWVNGSMWGSFAMTAGTDTLTVPLDDPGFRVYWPASAGDTPPAVSHVAAYNTAPSSTQLNAHYNVGKWAWTGAHGIYGFEKGGARLGRALDDIGWPTADRDLDTGGTRQAAYLPASRQALDYMREVERSEQGLVFVNHDGDWAFRDRQSLWTATPACTFSDDGDDIDYTAGDPDGNNVETIRNTVVVSWPDGSVVRQDDDSRDEFGEQPSGGLRVVTTISNPQDASNLGDYIARLGAEPGTIFPELEVDMIPNPGTQIPAVLGLEIGDVVTVERTPMGVGPQIAKNAQVLGIRGRLSADQLTVSLYLSPPVLSATAAPYLILGDETYGVIGSTGNLLLDDDDNVLTDDDDNPLYDDDQVGAGNMLPF